MKLRFWKGESPETIPMDAPEFSAESSGWKGTAQEKSTHPGAIYLLQLADERFALKDGAGYLIPWEKLYSLLSDSDHVSSLHLLKLPQTSRLRPAIRSHGTPTDTNFRVTLEAWIAESGEELLAERLGAVLTMPGQDLLLPQSAFTLLEAMAELAQCGEDWDADRRMLQMGKVQEAARWAGATMDRYLEHSPVVVANKLEINLKQHEAAEAQIVEVEPRPIGAPEGWLSQFDRYQSVRGRYDVTDAEGGMSHVVLSSQVREVGQQIKSMPGRRLAGKQADAFMHNPYAVLGEAAAQVISPERFAEAKRTAGIDEWELELQPADVDGSWDAVLVDSVGKSESVFVGSFHASEFDSLLEEASGSEGLGVARWKKHRVLLSGLTLESLARLRQAHFKEAVGSVIGVETLFDLAHYSDRVVGFDGKPIIVPKVQGSSPAEDWIKGAGEFVAVDPATGTATEGRLSTNDVQEFGERVDLAEREAHINVAVPGIEKEIPTPEARAWMKELTKPAGEKRIESLKNPAPAEKLSLRILHNIEELEYPSEETEQARVKDVYEAPAALRPEVALKDHQVEGVAWMQGRMRQRGDGVRGVLLADDMGLGKTLQALTLMAWYRQTAPAPKPCLIVAPVSLLENWKAEIAKFLDGRQGATLTLYGEHLALHRLSAREIGPELRELGVKKALNPGFAHGAAFVLTTYETLRDYQLSMAREKWGVLVCDEAQKIKTPSAMVTRSAKAMQADFKIACTGTPVENSLADLWCLFDFFQPGLLDSLTKFTKVFRQQIELRSEGHEQKVEVLREQISPWVLRRMKAEVADLKPKTELPCELAMSAKQRGLYAAAARRFRETVDSGEGGDTAALSLLHQLRQICANPLAAADDRSEFLSLDEHLRHSPKLAWLIEKLQEIQATGEKVIVFTEFRDIQRLIQRAIASRLSYQASIVNGSTSVEAGADDSRQIIIDAFHAKPDFGVIVLSTTAVGFGVNIQAANHVIHFTRPWNPAKEDQATDRAYRIGQEKEVFVYYPTVLGDGFESFEERVAKRLATKRKLSNDMLAPEQGLTLEEFSDLSLGFSE
ncbi:DEAD/DEAH box helicase [Xanthomonas campestris]|uniref:DEAD/DEAH box helicase n=1 Tax=Xanthomonas campestris TaxID=339 RepID=UPI002AD2EC15|nr:DEAD/DEAH box helicase [Xanthomonas campestris]MEA0953499.1 DEAD/DEAH box helicase [Xanthomonas campestris pv. campestris]